MESQRTAGAVDGELRIMRLVAENFKRLVAVDITPTGTITKISGKNGAGKSSVLDALAAAIGGPRLTDPMPIRAGETTAEVTVDLGPLKVRRKWTLKGNYLEVFAADGSKLKSPQTVLDTLFGLCCFDPLAFARLKPNEQRDTMLEMLGLSAPLTEIEKRQTAAYDRRRDINREAESLAERLAAEPPVHEDVHIDKAEVVRELDEAAGIESRISEAKLKARSAGDSLAHAISRHKGLEAKVERIAKELAEAKEEVAAEAARVDDLVVANREAQEALAKLPPVPDASALRERLELAIRMEAERDRAEKQAQERLRLAELRADADSFTRTIEQCQREKTTLLAVAEMPDPNLSLGPTGLLYRGVPFEQASTGERLRTSIAIGMRQNSRLRVMAVRDGSLLDADSMAIIEEVALANGYQVIIEITDASNKIGIVIAEGLVVARNKQEEGVVNE